MMRSADQLSYLRKVSSCSRVTSNMIGPTLWSSDAQLRDLYAARPAVIAASVGRHS